MEDSRWYMGRAARAARCRWHWQQGLVGQVEWGQVKLVMGWRDRWHICTWQGTCQVSVTDWKAWMAMSGVACFNCCWWRWWWGGWQMVHGVLWQGRAGARWQHRRPGCWDQGWFVLMMLMLIGTCKTYLKTLGYATIGLLLDLVNNVLCKWAQVLIETTGTLTLEIQIQIKFWNQHKILKYVPNWLPSQLNWNMERDKGDWVSGCKVDQRPR